MQKMWRRNSSFIRNAKQIVSESCELGKDLDEHIMLQLECKECYCHVDNFNQIDRIAEWIPDEEK